MFYSLLQNSLVRDLHSKQITIFFFSAVSLLAHLLTKEMTPHEVNICAIDQFMAGVDTVSKASLL